MLPGYGRHPLPAPEAQALGLGLMRLLVRVHNPHRLCSVQEERAPVPEALTSGSGGLLDPAVFTAREEIAVRVPILSHSLA